MSMESVTLTTIKCTCDRCGKEAVSDDDRPVPDGWRTLKGFDRFNSHCHTSHLCTGCFAEFLVSFLENKEG